MKFIIRWLVNSIGLLVTAYLIPGIRFENYITALVAALVLGIINAIIRPILLILTLPINILTLGIFTLFINALMFWLAGKVVPGFYITDYGTAFWAALVFSLISWFTSAIFNTGSK